MMRHLLSAIVIIGLIIAPLQATFSAVTDHRMHDAGQMDAHSMMSASLDEVEDSSCQSTSHCEHCNFFACVTSQSFVSPVFEIQRPTVSVKDQERDVFRLYRPPRL